MKKNISKILLVAFLAIAPALLFSQPNPGTNSNGGQAGGTGGGAPLSGSGGGAPVGSGVTILLSLAALYGAKEIYQTRKKIAE